MPDIVGFTTASPAVVLDGVDPHLIAYAQHLALLHSLLFGSDLVITSGKDSIHSPGSLHAQGKAIDVRIKDLDAAEQIVFLTVLNFSAPANECAIFDERILADESHVHIEYHGA